MKNPRPFLVTKIDENEMTTQSWLVEALNEKDAVARLQGTYIVTKLVGLAAITKAYDQGAIPMLSPTPLEAAAKRGGDAQSKI
jgi:hypothetical protein